jgi:hypothetical protein
MRIPRLNSATLEAAVLTVAVGLVLLWATWQLASPGPQPGAEELARDNQFLSSELAAVKQRLDRAQARLAVLERESGVLRQANGLLREQESERQAEMNTLQSELDFYRRLAGTGGQQSGLDVYRAELLPTGSPQVFQFQLTLTQNIRRASIITGRARIDVEGTLDDRPVTLPWTELGEGDAPEPSFRFKYFQQLEGYLALPEGFLPTRLVVTLEARDQRNPVQRSYAWESLLVVDAE